MPSAKIYRFPRPFRSRPFPLPVSYAARPYSRTNAGGFALLLLVTLPAASLYLSGAVDVARHDALYATLLAAVWGFYFTSDKLLRTRLGPLLMRAGRIVPPAAAICFFGFVLWLVLSHP